MSRQQVVSPLFNIPKAAEIKNLITENLMYDWVLRIEHSDNVDLYQTQWKQWGQTRYAVKNSDGLMQDIYACRARFSKNSIRLSAEKICPQTKITFFVYRPQDDMEQDAYHPSDIERVMTTSELAVTQNQQWPQKIYALMESGKAKVWRNIAIFCMLITSLILIEELAL